MEYKAYYVEENDGVFSSSIKELEIPEPSDGELLVSVSFSSLNYKDALCAKGVKGVAAFILLFLELMQLELWLNQNLMNLKRVIK